MAWWSRPHPVTLIAPGGLTVKFSISATGGQKVVGSGVSTWHGAASAAAVPLRKESRIGYVHGCTPQYPFSL